MIRLNKARLLSGSDIVQKSSRVREKTQNFLITPRWKVFAFINVVCSFVKKIPHVLVERRCEMPNFYTSNCRKNVNLQCKLLFQSV